MRFLLGKYRETGYDTGVGGLEGRSEEVSEGKDFKG